MDKSQFSPWSLAPEALLVKFNTSAGQGLLQEQITPLQEQFGKNTLRAQKKISQLTHFLHQFKNPMVYTLAAAALIALLLGEIIDAIAILAIVLLNSGIGYFQESKAAAAIDALEKLTVPKAKVIRDGQVRMVDSSDIVPGDLLSLEAGDYVVADSRIIEGFQLAADEAVLTGESMPVHKTNEILPEMTELAERKNMIFAGTAISAGSGKALVIATGMDSEIGKIARLMEQKEMPQTPLQQRLEKVSHKLLLLGGVVILMVTGLGIYHGQEWFEIFMAAISLSVAAIPEGLPTVVTLALTLAVRRMTKRNALIRNIAAVETLGSTDFICSDKTGTLTTGKMQVREAYWQSELITDVAPMPEELLKVLVLCNNASLDNGGSGDSTELALLSFVASKGIDLKSIYHKFPRLHEWSFDSDRKLMSVAVESNSGFQLLVKGAPDALVAFCEMPLDQRSQVEELIKNISGSGRRLLALAMRTLPEDYSRLPAEEVEVNLTFLGLVALADPPKAESIKAIEACKASGIKVAMITGDHPLTAYAIGRELGIPGPGFDQVLTGKELNELSAEELAHKAQTTAIYARVTPEHKLKIVQALKSRGRVVAMTGDGVNDAPALKQADIGVAMGKAGTEVARQASSMILTDDNFSTIVAAIEEGRAIFGNIKRTIQYLLSTNLAEIFIMLGASIMGLPAPLAPLALLWINLVTDGFPSLALAAEPVRRDYLKTSPGPSPKSFFDRNFIRELLVVAVLMTIVELVVYIHALKSDQLTARSYALMLLSYLCLFRSFSCRSESETYFHLPVNYWHIASSIVPILIQWTAQYTELYQRLFDVRVLTWQENLTLLALGILPVTVVELYKLWRFR
jgi:P-type Ca2+ transporter type 2C